MAYATLEMVHERLGITASSHDVQLANKITQANNWVDRQLGPYVTTPLAVPPQEVKDAEADIAAGLFREEASGKFTGERPMPHVLRARGERDLLDYIRLNYLGTRTRSTRMIHGRSHCSWDGEHDANQGDY
jgi:hypothetical protein